ncbi:MAG: molybdopterin converting factor subunit 1 [Bacteroidota bacterium]|nr:molybdopterin converting factor subunit 1 [Bacteroidota bacterium]
MKIFVKFFASAREAVGSDNVQVAVKEGATANDVLELFGSQFETMNRLRPYVRVAVNQSYVVNDHVLHEGDEVAIIPPVSGG